MITTGVAGVLLLAVGLIVLKDVYITPPFKFMALDPGIFTAVPPMAVLGGATFSVWRVGREGRGDWLNVGLLVGFGFAAAAKGVSLLGEAAGRVQAGGLVWILGGLLVGAAGVLTANQFSKLATVEQRREPVAAPAFVAVLGATMLFVGAVIPFNIQTGTETRIVATDEWLGADPIGIALAILVAVGLLFAGRRRLGAGLLLALGFSGALLWVRYIGIPVSQWLHTDGIASPRFGGLIGLAGGVLVFGVGCHLATPGRPEVSAPAPLSTT